MATSGEYIAAGRLRKRRCVGTQELVHIRARDPDALVRRNCVAIVASVLPLPMVAPCAAHHSLECRAALKQRHCIHVVESDTMNLQRFLRAAFTIAAVSMTGFSLGCAVASEEIKDSGETPKDSFLAPETGAFAEKMASALWPPSNAQACSTGADCGSGFCADGICCNTACMGTCQACTAAKKGSGVDGVCGAIKFDTDPDEECHGGACNGQSVCKFYNGMPCVNTNQCLSYCVDGVCCGNICSGTCQSCSAAKKGGGVDGACRPIAAGTDPDGECSPGACNGAGQCSSVGSACNSDAQCAPGFCVDGVCCSTACTGLCQACTTVKKGSGVDGVCGPIKFDTNPDNECAAGSACDGNGTCKFYNGVPCTNGNECLSYCVDGYCCGNVCTETCKACNVAGHEGSCAETSPGACSMACTGTVGLPAWPLTPVAGYPVLIKAADLNHDGEMDLVTASSNGGPVSVLLNSGQGSFSPYVVYPLGGSSATYAKDLIIADMNGDGDLDLVISADDTTNAQYATYLGVFFNHGNGTFGSRIDYNFDGTASFTAADLNGDSLADLAVVPEGSGLSVMLNQGNETFAPQVDYPDALYSQSVVAADLDGDGDRDLALGGTNTKIMLNNGNGTFALAINYSIQSHKGFKVVDINGDGSPDLVGSNGGVVSISFNNGNGIFAPKVDYAAAGTLAAVTDLNGNGYPDLTIAAGSSVDVMLNNGNGTFGVKQSYSVLVANNVIVADLNGDTKPDLAAFGYNGTSVLLNSGSGTFGSGIDYDYLEWGGVFRGTTAADVNGDGKTDFAMAQENNGSVKVLFNLGGGRFTTTMRYPAAGHLISMADLNGDGDVDILTTGAGVNWPIGVLLGNGDGTFAPQADSSTFWTPSDVVTADLNGDARPDLAKVGSHAFFMTVHFNNGDGTFAARVDHPSAAGRGIAAADLDGNTKIDLVVAFGGGVSVYFNDGNGQSFTRIDYSIPWASNPYLEGRIIAAEDLNADGKPDVAVVNGAAVCVFLNNGDGSFAPRVDYAMVHGAHELVVAHFDADNSPDFAILDQVGNSVSILRNSGNGTFVFDANYPIGLMPLSAAATDLNGDGYKDLSIATGSMLSVLFNTGNGTFAPNVDYPFSSFQVASADLNGDGRPEIAGARGASYLGVNVIINTCLP